jgi:hypothetical protein
MYHYHKMFSFPFIFSKYLYSNILIPFPLSLHLQIPDVVNLIKKEIAGHVDMELKLCGA